MFTICLPSCSMFLWFFFFFFQAEDGIRDIGVTGVQTCALPISRHYAQLLSCAACSQRWQISAAWRQWKPCCNTRSEEHTSELQSRQYLVCRLLLEKKKRLRRRIRGDGVPAGLPRVPHRVRARGP